MLVYAMPIMLVGFAGMINEVLDRIIMTRLLPFDDITNKEQLGIRIQLQVRDAGEHVPAGLPLRGRTTFF